MVGAGWQGGRGTGMVAEIRLVATDLDGTLIGSVNELPFYADFRDQMARLRERNGAIWVACTGRSHRSFREFFGPMRRMGLLPDYIILRHALIYRRSFMGFVPHLVWNISILMKLWREEAHANTAIDNWHETLTAGAVGVSTIRRAKNRLGLRFDSPQSAAVAGDLLRRKVREYRHLKVFVFGSDLEVRMIPATKGMALSELATYLNIERETVLAIGDGQNDLSMLDGTAAAMVGCPANADAEVIETVHQQGGHVAPHRTLRGVIDILSAYEENRVCSDLPTTWEPVHRSSSPARERSRNSSPRQRRPRTHPILFGAIAYAGLLVFACFDILPYVSVWIRLPLDLLIRLLVAIGSLW